MSDGPTILELRAAEAARAEVARPRTNEQRKSPKGIYYATAIAIAIIILLG